MQQIVLMEITMDISILAAHLMLFSFWNLAYTHGKYNTVETLYSTIYYSKYFIELNFDKSTQYVALWTHKRHSIARPKGDSGDPL